MMMMNPLNPTGRYSSPLYHCIYPNGRYSGLAIYHHNPIAAKWPKRLMVKFFVWSAFNGYCIVLYLYIYLALHAVLTNQKRFQCKRPREKRAILRERKEALGSPVSKVDRVKGRSWLCHTELVQISHHTRKRNSDISYVH